MLNNKIYVLLLLGLVLTVSSTFGQIVYDQPSSGGGRMIYSHWSIEDTDGIKKLNQFVIPIHGFIPMKDNLEARFSVSTISSKLENAGTEYKLAGLGDIRVQFNQSLANDQLLLSLGLNLPTGAKKLHVTDEWPVMQYLARDYINIPVRKYGEGFGINLLTGAATQVGDIQMGGSLSYGINGAYEAYEDGGDYKPGDMFSMSVGLDAPYKNWKLSGRISFSSYGVDKLDKRKIFKAGRQFALQFGAGTDIKGYGFRSNINYIISGRNTRYDSTEAINDQLRLYGNEFAWNNSLSFSPAETFYIVPSVELRFVGANEQLLGKSHLIGFGSEFGKKFANDVNANIGFKYYAGSADDGDIDLKGFQISFSMAAAFR